MNTLPAIAGAVYARVHRSMWIVDCPCSSALRLEPGERWFVCWDCGAGADVIWPPNLDDIAYVLAMRPIPDTRNWYPHETVAELLEENVAHGITPPAIPGLPPGVSFAVTNDRIVKLALAPSPRPTAAIEG